MIRVHKIIKQKSEVQNSLTISRHVVSGELLEVGGLEPLVVSIDCPHHAGPWLFENLVEGRKSQKIKCGNCSLNPFKIQTAVLTRYPSLGPSSSSPDSFRTAATTPKKGNVCGIKRQTTVNCLLMKMFKFSLHVVNINTKSHCYKK